MGMTKNPLQKFGERVRHLRKEQALSQEEFAERCHLHRNYIGSVERGERNIALLNILKIATALQVTPAQLLEGIEQS
jgi:transcriptional regulator with XRE-family HTH domain